MRIRERLLLWLILVTATPLFAQCSGNPILVYHRFSQTPDSETTITRDHLLTQWTHLQNAGYRFVPLKVFEDAIDSGKPLAKDDVIVTVDDGHESVYTVLFPIIRERRVPITLFIYPSIISRHSDALTWEQIKEMQSTGLVRIESHTYWHPDFRKEKRGLPPVAYESFVHEQLTKSKAILNRELHLSVRSLAWPYGIVDHQLEDAAQQAGYAHAYAFDGKLATVADDAYAIHRIPVPDSAGIGFIPCSAGRGGVSAPGRK